MFSSSISIFSPDLCPECFLPCHTYLEGPSLSFPPPPPNSGPPFIPSSLFTPPELEMWYSCCPQPPPLPHLLPVLAVSGEAWSLWLLYSHSGNPNSSDWAFRELLFAFLLLNHWKCGLPKPLPSSTSCLGSPWPMANTHTSLSGLSSLQASLLLHAFMSMTSLNVDYITEAFKVPFKCPAPSRLCSCWPSAFLPSLPGDTIYLAKS